VSSQPDVVPLEAQCADAVLMIRPIGFASNPETAATNAFQHPEEAPARRDAQPRAAAEFARVAEVLRQAGVTVVEVSDTPASWTPDSIFPNNWLSTHPDGRCVTYPMLAPNRRRERRADLFREHLPAAGFLCGPIVDLSPAEGEARFLEGTGSLVLDRPRRVAYACRSARTHESVARDFAARLGYSLELFDARDAEGNEIYHTNVMMSVGEQFAVVCAEAIADTASRARVLGRLAADGLEIIEISQQQMAGFAGNVLQLAGRGGERLLALSASAWAAFTPAQRDRLARWAKPLPVDIGTIEQCAGGSVRCMLAEIHLPRRDPSEEDDR
jgi:hypothetical protein